MKQILEAEAKLDRMQLNESKTMNTYAAQHKNTAEENMFYLELSHH